MNLKNLTTETMIQVILHWLDPEKARPALEAIEPVAPMMSMLKARYDDLIHVSPTEELSERLASLTGEAQEKDATHDAKLRGCYQVLTGLALLASPERAAAYIKLRDTLFPIGLSGSVLSFRDQAGAVIRLNETWTEEDQALLDTVQTPEGPLGEHIEVWKGAALRLGEIENERAVLEQGDDSVSQGDVVRSRNAWIRTMRIMLAILDEVELTEDTRNTLLGPLRKAESQARQRIALERRQHDEDTDNPTTDAPTGDAPTPTPDSPPES